MLNKVILIGNLTRDPELRYATNGTAWASFGLAVNRVFKREGQPDVDFFRVSVFGKQAEHCANYLSKGRMVVVDGRIEINTYEKEGQKRTSVDVTANDVRFLPGSGEGKSASSGSKTETSSGGYDSDISDDDLPF